MACPAVNIALGFVLVVSALAMGFSAGFIAGDPVRREVVLSKLGGSLPHRSIFEILRFVAPRGLPGFLGHLNSIHREQVDEGACPVQWETPFGLLWGRQSDHELLIFLMQEQFFRRIYERDPVTIRQGDVVIDAGANLGT